jgi:hypothetical protein
MASAEDALHEYGVKLRSWDELPAADALILAVPHKRYLEMPTQSCAKSRARRLRDRRQVGARRAGVAREGLRVWRLVALAASPRARKLRVGLFAERRCSRAGWSRRSPRRRRAEFAEVVSSPAADAAPRAMPWWCSCTRARPQAFGARTDPAPRASSRARAAPAARHASPDPRELLGSTSTWRSRSARSTTAARRHRAPRRLALRRSTAWPRWRTASRSATRR